MRHCTRSLLIVITVASICVAHDMAQHRGKPTAGVIAEIDGDRLTLDVHGQKTVVLMNADTKVEHGDKAVGRDHLMKGSSVAVFGTKLASGELAAREIRMHSDGEGQEQPKPMHTGPHDHDRPR